MKEKAEERGYFKVIVKNLDSLRSEGVAVGGRMEENYSKVTGEKKLNDFRLEGPATLVCHREVTATLRRI